MKRTDFAVRQSVGQRKRQEDAYGFATNDGHSKEALASADSAPEENPYLVVVADGMGGHAGGNIASQLAVRGFIENVDGNDAADYPALLRASMHAANESILQEIDDQPDLEGMGTTLVAAILKQGKVYFASVGDSLLFKFDGQTLSRLNADHSMRAILLQRVAQGTLEADQVDKHPRRNQLLSALGDEEIEMLDAPEGAIELAADDALIFASDGVETLSDARIAKIVGASKGDASTAADMLVRAVEEENKPKQDNCTVAVWYPLRAASEGATPAGAKSKGQSKALSLGLLGVFVGLALLGAGVLAIYDPPGTSGSGWLPDVFNASGADAQPGRTGERDQNPQPIVTGNPISDDALASGVDQAQQTGDQTDTEAQASSADGDLDRVDRDAGEAPAVTQNRPSQAAQSQQEQAAGSGQAEERPTTNAQSSQSDDSVQGSGAGAVNAGEAAKTEEAGGEVPRIEAENVVTPAADPAGDNAAQDAQDSPPKADNPEQTEQDDNGGET